LFSLQDITIPLLVYFSGKLCVPFFCFVGGVVAAGESYEITNKREIEEEMGIKDVFCEHLFTFYYEDDRIRCFGDAWEVVYNGSLRLQKEEVDAVEKMSMREILSRFDSGEMFTPDSVFACREYVKVCGYQDPLVDKPQPIVILE
jgi:ADP-ribose pyrophosphatase YjhB (NUDIX family)